MRASVIWNCRGHRIVDQPAEHDHVAAGRESLPDTGRHDCFDVVVGVQCPPDGREGVMNFLVDGIERFRPVNGDDVGVALLLNQQPGGEFFVAGQGCDL